MLYWIFLGKKEVGWDCRDRRLNHTLKLKKSTHSSGTSIYSQTCPCSHIYKVVTCIKRSHFSCPFIEDFIWIEPLLRGHLSYTATFFLSLRWPLNTGLTVYRYTGSNTHPPWTVTVVNFVLFIKMFQLAFLKFLFVKLDILTLK